MKDKIVRKKDFLVCIDSDGCAMDTMNIKHENYFGPIAADIYKIKDREFFLEKWNKINLYSKTRGINRFKGLLLSLIDAIERGEEIEDISNLKKWVENSKELSNTSLKKEIEINESEDLKKAFKWSINVNKGIEELVGKDSPFPNVLNYLKELHKIVDIAIVSSANNEALYSEWGRHGLLEHVDAVFGQEEGSKSACIQHLKTYGYENNNILMVGDSPGDLDTAIITDVLYYPILFGQEEYSWKRLIEEAVTNMIEKDYRGLYQKKLVKEFNDLLDSQ